MSSVRITIIVIAFSIISYAKLVGGEDVQEEEKDTCPRICTCHTSHFAQLPLISMIHSDIKNFDFITKEDMIEPSYKNQNEVLDEEDEKLNRFHHSNPLMKMAVCVVKEENEIMEALQSLETIEALTLLQSSDTENITLRGNYFNGMKQLKVLEIHGIDQEKSNQNHVKIGHLYLKYDALSQIDTLEYVNLQSVQLLGSPRLGNKIPPISVYNYMNKKLESNQILPIIQPDYEQKVQRDSQLKLKLLLKNLVFLTPNEAETDILPYEVYKEEQQRAGMYSFAGLKNLKFLRVYRCNLTEINWEMFDGLHNLETLSLEDNNLLFMPEFAFYGTPRLKTLSLAHNSLLNIQYMSLAGLLQLQHIDLSYNNITHLSELSLPPFPRLVTADFTNNPLVIIFPSTFEIMNATQELHLGDAHTVLDIQPNSFSGLRSLLKLTLKNVDVEILEREIFRGMPQLRLLKISGKIKSVAFDAFLDLPKLEKLILKNCSIEKLSMDSFYGLYNLRTLDLSHNLLSSLPPGLFDQQFSLKDLFLQHNNLTNLPAGFFANVPAKMIRLDGNPWHCSCAMKDWKPSVINQIKQKTKDSTKCQFRFDKGSMCSLTTGEEYVYDKKVEPRCTTPKKFKGWGVFHLLHKELRCDKKQKIMKINRKAYLAQKMLDYEQMLQNYKKVYNNKRSKINNDNLNRHSKSEINKNENSDLANELSHENLSKILTDSLIKPGGNRTDILESRINYSEKTGNYTSLSQGNSAETFNNQLNDLPKAYPPTEQKITKKEKEKLQLLQEKEERIRMKQKIKDSEKVDPSKLKKIMQADLENKRKEKLKMLNLKS